MSNNNSFDLDPLVKRFIACVELFRKNTTPDESDKNPTEELEMKHVLDPKDLIVGREYWLRDKETGEAHISLLIPDEDRYYFDFRIWAYPENNQAMQRWDIFGPIPTRQVPDFEVMMKENKVVVDKATEVSAESIHRVRLHADIMNIKANVPVEYILNSSLMKAYQLGHRDARHVAASLVLSSTTKQD